MKHYTVNVVPVLLMEILGDLKKYREDTARSESKVRALAQKLSPVDSAVNVHWSLLTVYSLLGGRILQDGRPAVAGAQSIVDSRGDRGLFFDESPEEKALHRWRAGDFSAAEEILADRWRQITRSLDLEGVQRALRRTMGSVIEVGSHRELVVLVREALLDEAVQTKHLGWLLSEIDVAEDASQAIWKRWEGAWPTTLRRFAPYAYYVETVLMSFYLGLANRVIGTRSTNRVDLEYLFYLPFCYVFSTRDDEQAALAQALLDGARPTFVHGDDLKADLARIADHWEGLSEGEKEQIAFDYGHYPPDLEGSVTAALWKKYMRPWTPGSGNRAIRMSEEEKARLLDYLRPIQSAIDQLENGPSERERSGAKRREPG